jgi:hypothetical protein
MYRSIFAKALSLVMAVLFPLSAFAADSRAMLLPQGNVTVNGNVQTHSTVLFAGDRVSTTDTSSGTITLRGSSIQLAPQSSLVYTDRAVELASGGASVATSSGVEGKVSNLSLAPAEGKVRYNFAQRGDKIVIAALEGKLRINDGRQQMVLDAGKAIEIPAADPQTKGGNASGAATNSFFVSNGRAIAIAAASVAIGLGAAYGLTGERPGSASPK